MSRIDLIFETEKFNITEIGDHFINPSCFGEDLATWLRDELKNSEYDVDDPGQEDFGWYLGVVDKKNRNERYFVGIGGNKVDEESIESRLAEWRIMIEKKRTIADKLLGKNKFQEDSLIVEKILEILRSDSDIYKVRIE